MKNDWITNTLVFFLSIAAVIGSVIFINIYLNIDTFPEGVSMWPLTLFLIVAWTIVFIRAKEVSN